MNDKNIKNNVLLNMVYKQCKKRKKCTSCGARVARYKRVHLKMLRTIALEKPLKTKPDDNNDDSDNNNNDEVSHTPVEAPETVEPPPATEETVVFTADECKEFLMSVSDNTYLKIGLKSSSVFGMICSVLRVSPPSMRPTVVNGHLRSEDDITFQTHEIIKSNQHLIKKMEQSDTQFKEMDCEYAKNLASYDKYKDINRALTSQEKKSCEKLLKRNEEIESERVKLNIIIEEYHEALQYHVFTLFDNKTENIPTAQQRTGRSLKSVRDRLHGKHGRVRHNLMGKRVDYSARTVIGGDPLIAINEVGIPVQVATTLTFPETVNPYNEKWLRELVTAGPYNYPGANFVILKQNGKEFKNNLKHCKRVTVFLFSYELEDKLCLCNSRYPTYNYDSAMWCELCKSDGMVFSTPVDSVKKCMCGKGSCCYGYDLHDTTRVIDSTDRCMLCKEKGMTRVILVINHGDVVERHLCNPNEYHLGDVVAFNRQPSLHRMSIMCHSVRVLPYNNFRMNPSATSPYNADFDGDEMNLHLPRKQMSKFEGKYVMNLKQHFINPQSNKPCMGTIMDTSLGLQMMVREDQYFTRQEVIQMMTPITTFTGYLPPPIDPKLNLWNGFQVFSLILPPVIYKEYGEGGVVKTLIEHGVFKKGIVTKKMVGTSSLSLVHMINNDFGPDAACQYFTNVQVLICAWFKTIGFSVGISDIIPDVYTNRKIQYNILEVRKEVGNLLDEHAVSNDDTVNPDVVRAEFESKVIQMLNITRDSSGKIASVNLNPKNSIKQMVGISKGSFVNVSQIMASVGQQNVTDQYRRIGRVPNSYEGRPIPHVTKYDFTPGHRGFLSNSYYTGLGAKEFFFHAMAGREGIIDTSIKTADTGYIQRQLTKRLEDISVKYDGTSRNELDQVVEYIHGGDGYDPRKIERHRIPAYLKNKDVFLNTFQVKNKSGEIVNEDEMAMLLEQKKLYETRFVDLEYLSLPIYIPRLMEYYNHNKEEVINEVDDIPLDCETTFQIISDFCDQLVFNSDPNNPVLSDLCKQSSLLTTMHIKFELSFTKVKHMSYYQLLEFCSALGDKVCRAYIAPGSAVGIVTCQSLGEPCMQLTLDAFHSTGFASQTQMTNGVYRFKEVMTLTKNPSNRSMTIPFKSIKDHDEYASETEVYALQHKLSSTKLSEIVDETCIFYDPDISNSTIESDRDWLRADISLFNNTVPKPNSVHTDNTSGDSRGDEEDEEEEEEDEEEGGDDEEEEEEEDEEGVISFIDLSEDEDGLLPVDDVDVDEAEEGGVMDDSDSISPSLEDPIKGCSNVNVKVKGIIGEINHVSKSQDIALPTYSMFVIRIRIDPYELYDRALTMQYIYKQLITKYAGSHKIHIMFADDNADKCYMYIRLPYTRGLDDTKVFLKLLQNTVITGIDSITKTFVRKTSKNVYKDGNYTEKEMFVVDTEGSNLAAILSMKHVDLDNVYTDNIMEIVERFGIYAGETALKIELKKVMETSGIQIDDRHYDLLVMSMITSGIFLPINRHGSKKGDSGPLSRCSFEETCDQIVRAGVYGETDTLQGVSSNIIMAQLPKIGSGICDIVIDSDKTSGIDSPVEKEHSHTTLPRMFLHEYTKLIGMRVTQLENNAPTFVTRGDVDGLYVTENIAKKELELNILPLKIVRLLRNGKREYWKTEHFDVIDNE
jgi:DNA-directed RNA polymerase beta' subunit